MMRLYADRRFHRAGANHVALLAPFWGQVSEPVGSPDAGRFDRYERDGARFFSLAPLEQADAAVLPAEWQAGAPNAEAHALAREAARLGKPTIVFFNHDSDEVVPLERTVVFRTSFYRSSRRSNEFAVPGWSADFLEQHCAGRLLERPYREKPVVGFCGYAAERPQAGGIRSRAHTLRSIVSRIRPLAGSIGSGAALRGRAVQVLAQDSRIATNFVIRSEFWNGCIRADGGMHAALAAQSRREYVANMLQSDYVLCVRGGGNFSYRLYETLSLGRIPILIGTDCVLPYESEIDWRRYAVWIDQNDVRDIGDRVKSFHASLSPGDFRQLQHDCRAFWEQWLSPVGFFSNFHLHFRHNLTQAAPRSAR